MKLVPSSALMLASAVLFACGGSSDDTSNQQHDVADNPCESAEGADTFTAGMSKTGAAGYEFTLISADPAPPGKYDNTWVIGVKDPEGAPVTDAELGIIPWMPEHGHGANRDAIVTNNEDGTYSGERVNFSMPGVWETTIEVADDAGEVLDSAKFYFCIQ